MYVLNVSKKFFEVFKALIASYVLTGLVLAILALLVFKYEIGENVVNMGITATYIIATLLGGFILGKKIREKKFIWGILLGLLYMAIIFAASLILNQGIDAVSSNNLTTFLLCIGGGMLGGMLS